MQGKCLVPVLAVFWSVCVPVRAQDNREVIVGDKVRVNLQDGKIVGILAALDTQALTLKDLAGGQLTPYPLGAVRGVEVSHGRHSRGRKAGQGALIGGLVGAVLGVAATTLCNTNDEGCGGDWPLIVGAGFGATGAAFGALIGVAMDPGEAWRPAKVGGLHGSTPAARRGLSVRVAVRF